MSVPSQQAALPLITSQVIDPGTGFFSQAWYRLIFWFYQVVGGNFNSTLTAAFVQADDAGSASLVKSSNGVVLTVRVAVELSFGNSPASFTAPGSGTYVFSKGAITLSRGTFSAVVGSDATGGTVFVSTGDQVELSWTDGAPTGTFFPALLI